MSPEVCESKPYTYKADAWALGCVLYELCQLEHAFMADNLLGLVYKIVQEKPGPLSEEYSPEFQKIVNLLLQKDIEKRPTVSQLLQLPYVRSKMEEFIKSGGLTKWGQLHTRKVKEKKEDEEVDLRKM